MCNEKETKTRLSQCLSIKNIGRVPIPVNVFDFSDTDMSSTDFKTGEFDMLCRNFGSQLLLPLFQDTPPYSFINRNGSLPRFTQADARDEVELYTGIRPRQTKMVSYILSYPQSDESFENLIGYANGYGLENTPFEQLVCDKFQPGCPGTLPSDTFKLVGSINTQDVIYFNGIGIAREFQGNGLGLWLTYTFLKKAKEKGYNKCLTRIVRGAGNWNVFTGGVQTPSLPGTQVIGEYVNTEFDKTKPYRVIFLTDIEPALQYLENRYKFI